VHTVPHNPVPIPWRATHARHIPEDARDVRSTGPFQDRPIDNFQQHLEQIMELTQLTNMINLIMSFAMYAPMFVLFVSVVLLMIYTDRKGL
jgi:fatty-acid desaturase